MNGFFEIMSELFFRLKLYLFGIRFYERPQFTASDPIYEAEYRLDEEKRIKFKFFRVACSDIILKRGKVTTEEYASYVVQAFLSETFTHEMQVFDGKSFFFNGMSNDFFSSNQRTVELILDVYMDFLKSSMANV